MNQQTREEYSCPERRDTHTLESQSLPLFKHSLPLPSMLVDNEVCSLSGTISEVNVEGVCGGGIIDLTLEAMNPCEV